MYKNGASYNTINLARSAVAAYMNKSGESSMGKHPLVCRLLKGVFSNRPALPKYLETWNVEEVLSRLRVWGPSKLLNLKELSLRTVLLLMLASGQRCQTIHALTVQDLIWEKDVCVVTYTSLLKQTKPGKHLKPLKLNKFINDENVCVFENLKEYQSRTENIRSSKALFISTIKPHNGVAIDTISGWIKSVLEMCGVDISVFSAHSVRSAATSAAFSRDVPIDKILDLAGWSSQSTFNRFYCRSDRSSGERCSQSVLDNFVIKSKECS